MLDGIEWLGVDFRAHVKTHKVSWTSINDHLVRAS
jgi:D-serine deaminase-like pyridoxal phosphate-dependent protein